MKKILTFFIAFVFISASLIAFDCRCALAAADEPLVITSQQHACCEATEPKETSTKNCCPGCSLHQNTIPSDQLFSLKDLSTQFLENIFHLRKRFPRKKLFFFKHKLVKRIVVRRFRLIHPNRFTFPT